MIKKFNELYGPDQEMDRSEWTSAPEIPDLVRSDKENISTIKRLYSEMLSKRITTEDFISQLGIILSISNSEFPAVHNL